MLSLIVLLVEEKAPKINYFNMYLLWKDVYLL